MSLFYLLLGSKIIVMNASRLLTALITLLLLSSCKIKSNKDEVTAVPFPYVQAPALMSDASGTQKWMVAHFWDKFFDSTRVYSPDTSLVGGVTEREFNSAFTKYALNISDLPVKNMLEAQKVLIEKAIESKEKSPGEKIYDRIVYLNHHFFYNVNSPYRNEEAYIPILEALINSPFEDPVNKEKYVFQLERCKLNRLGQPANNFRYALRSGQTGELYDLVSDFTLLLFTNPDCQSCAEVVEAFSRSEEINRLIERERLKIINIYIDQELELWLTKEPEYPKNWINVYDPDMVIRTDEIYNIRGIPSLYLLDADKKVIFKDPDPEPVFEFLNQQSLR